MSLRPVLVALLMAGAALSQPEKKTAPPPDFKAETQKLLDAWATLDPSNAEQFYAKDAGNVYYDVAPMKYTGWKAYAEGAPKALHFAQYQSAKFTVNPDFRSHLRGSFAWTTYTFQAEFVRKDGSKEPLAGRATDLWEKRGDLWLIVHEHVSAPLGAPEPPPKKKK